VSYRAKIGKKTTTKTIRSVGTARTVKMSLCKKGSSPRLRTCTAPCNRYHQPISRTSASCALSQ